MIRTVPVHMFPTSILAATPRQQSSSSVNYFKAQKNSFHYNQEARFSFNLSEQDCVGLLNLEDCGKFKRLMLPKKYVWCCIIFFLWIIWAKVHLHVLTGSCRQHVVYKAFQVLWKGLLKHLLFCIDLKMFPFLLTPKVHSGFYPASQMNSHVLHNPEKKTTLSVYKFFIFFIYLFF